MAAETTPHVLPEVFVSDVTLADVNALASFLRARTERLKEAHAEGTEESRAAWALECAMFPTLYSAQVAFQGEATTEVHMQIRRDHWNELCRIARPWTREADYSDRWRLLAGRLYRQ
jgi:hypothetical protein